MANWYVSSAGWAAVTPWAASTAVTVGTLRRQLATPAALNERVFRCTTAGTTGSTEPSWGLNKNNTTNDGTVVWQEVTGQEAYQTPGNWAAPHASISVTSYNYASNGDTIFVAPSHNKLMAVNTPAQGGGVTSPKFLFCVDDSAASHVPPLASDVRSGALEGSSGAFAYATKDSWSEINGVSFISGSGATSQDLVIGNSGSAIELIKNCTLSVGGTTGGKVQCSYFSGSKCAFENVSFKFASSSSSIALATEATFKDIPQLIAGGSAMPSTLLTYGSNQSCNASFENVDLTSFTGSTLIAHNNGGVSIRFQDCKIPSNVLLSAASPSSIQAVVEFVNCDSGGLIGRHERYTFTGAQLFETVVVRTGGAAPSGYPASWRIATNANSPVEPFASMPIAAWNTTTGSTVNATIEGIWNAALLPTQDDLYFDLRYPGTAGSTLGSRVSGRKANGLATAASFTASAAAWDSLAATRANSQAYTVGQVVKVASNPGRIFFCTAAGSSAASEPAGYASAVDGGTVTDGGATFRAGVRFKQVLSFTAAQVGLVTATVRAARASATFYVDPLLTLG
jgi:hypothetical protein